MKHKNLTAVIYLKDGAAVKGRDDDAGAGEFGELARLYNDSGVDQLYVFDLSDTEQGREAGIEAVKKLCRIVEIPIYGTGNIEEIEDMERLLHAGCKGVILNSTSHDALHLMEEGARRFGREKLLFSIGNADFIFKHRGVVERYVQKLVVLNDYIIGSIEDLTTLPCSVIVSGYDTKSWVEILKKDWVTGIGGDYLSSKDTDVSNVKKLLAAEGITTKKFESSMEWKEFKLNSDGLLPVVVQHYQTGEVLMVAYMNEEAFQTTLSLGKMAYYSRSRKKLWIKGETSGHYQYVKSLTIDCDKDTLLAGVSQVGAACHTGNQTCFYQDLFREKYVGGDPLKVLETLYGRMLEKKAHAEEKRNAGGLFGGGQDKILKKLGADTTGLLLAAKNQDSEDVRSGITDLLYHTVALMAEKGITWDDIVEELSQR